MLRPRPQQHVLQRGSRGSSGRPPPPRRLTSNRAAAALSHGAAAPTAFAGQAEQPRASSPAQAANILPADALRRSASPSPGAGGAGRAAEAVAGEPRQPTAQHAPPPALWVALSDDVTTAAAAHPKAVAAGLRALRRLGASGVVLDLFWGDAEPEPGRYEWGRYAAVMALVEEAGLRLQANLCFHGTRRRPLPAWVLRAGEAAPDIFYTDRSGRRHTGCLSLGVDRIPALAGRTAARCYADCASSFASDHARILGSVISDAGVGLGPGGDLRYPSHPLAEGLWAPPGTGEFQCYDAFMQASLAACAAAAGCPEWADGGGPGAAAGVYTQWPAQSEFWREAEAAAEEEAAALGEEASSAGESFGDCEGGGRGCGGLDFDAGFGGGFGGGGFGGGFGAGDAALWAEVDASGGGGFFLGGGGGGGSSSGSRAGPRRQQRQARAPAPARAGAWGLSQSASGHDGGWATDGGEADGCGESEAAGAGCNGGWSTPYGRFFCGWYSACLARHADTVLAAAGTPLASRGVALHASLPLVPWWAATAARAAEATAGFCAAGAGDLGPYLPAMRALAVRGAGVVLRGAELASAPLPPAARCAAGPLLLELRGAAAAAGVPAAVANGAVDFRPRPLAALAAAAANGAGCHRGVDVPPAARLVLAEMGEAMFEGPAWAAFRQWAAPLAAARGGGA